MVNSQRLVLSNGFTGASLAVFYFDDRIKKVLSCKQALFSMDPLPCVVVLSSADNSLKVYAMTGHLLADRRLKTEAVQMALVQDADGCDVLALLDLQSGLSFFRLPDLEETRRRIKMQQVGLVDLMAGAQSLVLSTDSEIIVCQ